MGWNVEQLLRRLERRPLSGTGDFRNGRTPFEKLTADFKIADGIATVENRQPGGLEGPARAGRLGLDPGARFRSARGRRARLHQRGDAPPAFELPFVVQGPWDDPILLPDTQSLIQRSPVASPLLNAVRNRNTRDTVRSAHRAADRRRHQPAGRGARRPNPNPKRPARLDAAALVRTGESTPFRL